MCVMHGMGNVLGADMETLAEFLRHDSYQMPREVMRQIQMQHVKGPLESWFLWQSCCGSNIQGTCEEPSPMGESAFDNCHAGEHKALENDSSQGRTFCTL